MELEARGRLGERPQRAPPPRLLPHKLEAFLATLSPRQAQNGDTATLKTAIERHDLDRVMMALNAATRSGFATGFEIAPQAARQKRFGILAMKIAGQEQLVGSGPGGPR